MFSISSFFSSRWAVSSFIETFSSCANSSDFLSLIRSYPFISSLFMVFSLLKVNSRKIHSCIARCTNSSVVISSRYFFINSSPFILITYIITYKQNNCTIFFVNFAEFFSYFLKYPVLPLFYAVLPAQLQPVSPFS